jgi:anti-sigma regulatory factor (Ser/Thr protein kinase)
MINVDNLTHVSSTVQVTPSDNIFAELGKNTYDFKDLLSELIDNSIAASTVTKPVSVVIDIYVDASTKPVEFVIRDNARGIPPDKLGIAITPAGIQTIDSLNEHGLGMKQAISALGTLKYLATKTANEPSARVVLKFQFGDIPIYEADFDSESGTEIAITNLSPIVTANPASITRSLSKYLGARYRRFLKPDNKSLDLKINIRKQANGQVTNYWELKEVKPYYFHPYTRTNKPVILKYPVTGNGWKAELTFGYAPQESEYEEMGIDPPTKFDPYHISLNRQGLDVILHNRVILFHQLAELGFVPTRHPDYNSVRGEIDLIEGFSTAITKNSIIYDNNFRDCIDEITSILKGDKAGPDGQKKNYLSIKTYPDQIPEKLLRDRLAAWLQSNPLNQRSDVKTEFAIQGIEGFVDILADGEAWELKTDQADARDVYQLFMYMDVGNFEKGFLVAKSFTTGAKTAADYVKTKHGKLIKLSKIDQFPIGHQPSDIEREEYY